MCWSWISLSLGQPVTLSETATRLPLNIWFWATGFLYFVLTIYWTWLLTKIPLAIAYPFVSLTLVIVPCLCWALFSETLSLINVVGIMLVVVGVALVAH
jgi:multidrug transporter EmrE-like cation transporter